MSVVLLAIQFNHDPNSASTNALNIRKNAVEFVTVPEWRRGVSFNPRDSLAAYALAETFGNTLTIQAKFASDDPEITSVEVRAIQPRSKTPPPWLLRGLSDPLSLGVVEYQLYLWYYQGFVEAAGNVQNNVLGDVQPRLVSFGPSGESDFELFRLQNVWLWSYGVGIHNIAWRWQYRRGPGEPWTDFEESLHKIYAVLETPNLPWVQTPYDVRNTQLPWTDVFDYACRWAFGTTTLDDAATTITRAVNNLGPSLLEYECRGMGGSHYTIWPLNLFECSRFLERLRGEPGNGRFLNCSDCASIVSTFANSLGCDLWQSRMSPISPLTPFFAVNPILAIGTGVVGTPCGWPGFAFHEVAWKGFCTSAEAVFDACLQVNGGINPTVPPFIPVLPTNMLFGNILQGQYRDRLAAPLGRVNCQPHPETRLRRPVS